jgi:hypothetical protein
VNANLSYQISKDNFSNPILQKALPISMVQPHTPIKYKNRITGKKKRKKEGGGVGYLACH